MEIQIINISEKGRRLISQFMNVEYPSQIDFNHLMPVVEKIVDVLGKQFPTSSIDFKICYGEIKIMAYNEDDHDRPYSYLYLDHSGKSQIEEVYKAVIEFIKWYNKT